MKKILFVALMIYSTLSFSFTQVENDALKAAIMADPTQVTNIANGNDGLMAEWFNGISTFIVWRTYVTQEEYQSREDLGTTFNWSSTGGFIGRSQGERDAWRTIFASGSANPSKANVLAAFDDIFSGTGAGAVANRAHLLAVSKRPATNAEKALATGTGTSITPGLLTFEGTVQVNEVHTILGRN